MSSTSLRAPIADSRLINAVPSRAPIVVAIRHPAPLTRRDTSVHPVAVAVPITAFAWFLVTCWVAFAGGETSLNLAVITFLSVIFFGLIVGGGALSFDPTRGQVQQRTFKEFLDGSVDIATGRISGRTALLQTCLTPIVLAIGGTVIVGCAVAVGIRRGPTVALCRLIFCFEIAFRNCVRCPSLTRQTPPQPSLPDTSEEWPLTIYCQTPEQGRLRRFEIGARLRHHSNMFKVIVGEPIEQGAPVWSLACFGNWLRGRPIPEETSIS